MSFYVAAYDTEALYPIPGGRRVSVRIAKMGSVLRPNVLMSFWPVCGRSPKRTFNGKPRSLFFSWLNC